MFSIAFLSLSALAIWTGVVLLGKGSNELEIKKLLKEMSGNTLSFFDVSIKLFGNLKRLFLLLNDSTKQEDLNPEIDPEQSNSVLHSPKLININQQGSKEVA